MENVTFNPGDTVQLIGLAGTAVQTSIAGTLDVDYTNGTVGGTVTDGLGRTYSNFTYNLNPTTGAYSLTGSTGGVLPSTLTVAYANTQAPSSVAVSGTTAIGTSLNVLSSATTTAAVTSSAVCFAAGTKIKALTGEIAVEDLAIGDMVLTTAGLARPVRWIGSRVLKCGNHPDPRSVWPVRIAAHAFGRNKPHSDLLLSPDHSVCLGCIDEVLIPIRYLVNGSSIAYQPVEKVAYYHIELDSHDVVLANGMPAETYLEMRETTIFFDRGDEEAPATTYGTHADFCRPFVDHGPVLEAFRIQTNARVEAAAWRPDRTVNIQVMVDGVLIRPLVVGDDAFLSFSSDARDVRIVTDMFTPAMLGSEDVRSLGIAVYALTLGFNDGASVPVDLDQPSMRGCFWEGERQQGLHYRWTRQDLMIPRSLYAAGDGTVSLHMRYESSTIRRWLPPQGAEKEAKPLLFAVA